MELRLHDAAAERRGRGELTLRGVGGLDGGTIVIDVGGGSTELTRSDGRVSTDLGSVRLTERFLGSRPADR